MEKIKFDDIEAFQKHADNNKELLKTMELGWLCMPGAEVAQQKALDERFQGNALVALKGSWGTQPTGSMFGKKSTRRPPAVSMVQFSNGKPAGVVNVISGFQRPNGARLARPVGVAIGPDGALYFTSDTHTEGLFRLRAAP